MKKCLLNLNDFVRLINSINKLMFNQKLPWLYYRMPIENTYSAFVSGVGKSPMVVKVKVDQYKEPKYFLVKVA